MQKANMLFLLEYGEDIEPLYPADVIGLAKKYNVPLQGMQLPYNGYCIYFEYEGYKYAIITVLKKHHNGESCQDSVTAGRIKIPSQSEIEDIIRMMTQGQEASFETNEEILNF